MSNKPYAQIFSAIEPEYRLNERTHCLELTGLEINWDDRIQSAHVSTLDTIFDKYLNTNNVVEDKNVSEYRVNTNKLDIMTEAFVVADELRAKYRLPETLSAVEVFQKVQEINGSLKDKIAKIQNPMEESNKNEKKNIEKSE